MFDPIIETFEYLRSRVPWLFRKRRLNFITIHYIYLLSLAIVGSILLFPAGGLAYIDALFFATGAATQSGLNPVDVNKLKTYQQVILYFMAMIANPIFINTFVVFIRLYWFERRFQHVVREARNGTRSRSRSKSEAVGGGEEEKGHRGVNGRNIILLGDGRKLSKGDMFGENTTADTSAGVNSVSPSGSSPSRRHTPDLVARQDQQPEFTPKPPQQTPTFRREVTFADEVRAEPTVALSTPLPYQMSPEQHIAFLENQRNPKDKGILRIPGPREYDRGDMPETLDNNRADLSNQVSTPTEQTEGAYSLGNNSSNKHADQHTATRAVTIEEPESHHPVTGLDASPDVAPSKSADTHDLRRRPTADTIASFMRNRTRTATWGSFRNSSSKEKDPTPYLSWQPTIGRNSAFIDLTQEQREELGGIEYRSLKTLAIVLVLYFVSFHLLGVVTLLPWIVRTNTWGSIVDGDGQSRAWWGIFTPASMFNDLGFTLTPDSMVSFNAAVLPMLLGSYLIIIGNTGFPCMLRLIIWSLTKLVPKDSGVWEEFKFLLDHPRRCFTLLFPSDATWWLFWVLVLFNGIDLVFYIILDLHDPAVTSVGPAGYRVLDGLFQAASTRTAGFAVANLSALHPGIQVSYLIMMYISVFPIAISVRRTNVYEEKSLGIYASSSDDAEDEKETSYVGAHLRRQLSFDLWYVFLGFFVIAVAEGGRISNTNDYAFTMFSVLFEIVSAYGTVGLSLGYPNINASFSAEFNVVSKLVIIAMQIRGRHRGLPYELDRAILLPSESLHTKEDADAAKRITQRNSRISGANSSASTLERLQTMGTTTGREQDGGIAAKQASNYSNHSSHNHHPLGKMMAGIARGPAILEDAKEKALESHK